MKEFALCYLIEQYFQVSDLQDKFMLEQMKIADSFNFRRHIHNKLALVVENVFQYCVEHFRIYPKSHINWRNC